MHDELQDLLQPILSLAKAAGEAILAYHGGSAADMALTEKANHTPVTKADADAHHLISSALQALTPDIPILSEEAEMPSFSERSAWSTYWLLDPLDGTRGFVAGQRDFTVNIALVENGKPILGVVEAPALQERYGAIRGGVAFHQKKAGLPKTIKTRQLDWMNFEVLLGRYLDSEELPQFFSAHPGCVVHRLNSSLKLCWLASGRADFYPRLSPIMEWDTAAAQCILQVAGGDMVDLRGETLQYNAQDSLLVPPCVAIGDPSQKERILGLIEIINRRRVS